MAVLAFALALLLLPHPSAAEDANSPISPLTRFDAKGQLPQSDAAARAVARGAPVIALSTQDAVLLVAPSQRRPRSLVEGRGLPKMWRLTPRICLSHAGLTQDSRVLLLAAQQAALEHESKFGETIPLGELVEVVAGKQQEATMQGSKRPFGSSLLVVGLLGEPGGRGKKYPRIYRTDPSGAYTLWKACALGQGADKVMALLEEKYQPHLSTKEALALALECCRSLLVGGGGGGGGGNEDKAAEEEGRGMGETGVAAVDVALVSAKGVKLWEALSPLEKLVDLDGEADE